MPENIRGTIPSPPEARTGRSRPRKLGALQGRILAALLRASGGAGVRGEPPLVDVYAFRAVFWPGREPTETMRRALTDTLARLEEMGLVRRERWFVDARGRRVQTTMTAQLRLTEAGAEAARGLAG